MTEVHANDSDVRDALVSERERLQSHVAELNVAEHPNDYDVNFADSGQVAAEQGENKSLYDRLKHDLDAIDKALSRMDEGTYGECEVCGGNIGVDRLEAMPEAIRCIEHA